MPPRFSLRCIALAFVITALFAPDTPVAAQPPSSTTITASFWNIQWFPGRRPNASRAEENRQIRAVHRDIAQLAPDVLGLEEVRDFRAGIAGDQAVERIQSGRLFEFSAA